MGTVNSSLKRVNFKQSQFYARYVASAGGGVHRYRHILKYIYLWWCVSFSRRLFATSVHCIVASDNGQNLKISLRSLSRRPCFSGGLMIGGTRIASSIRSPEGRPRVAATARVVFRLSLQRPRSGITSSRLLQPSTCRCLCRPVVSPPASLRAVGKYYKYFIVGRSLASSGARDG